MTARFWPASGRPAVVRFEQAVYGNFAFWDQGYGLLAQSPGCRPEWLVEFLAACQKLGERPSGVADWPGLFALRLPSGPWLVVGFWPQGCDDRGRPGALAFHGLFLTARDYRRARCDPFAFTRVLRGEWSAETQSLPSGTLSIVEPAPVETADPATASIVQALLAGRPVALEAPAPIEGLARQVWRGLPPRARARLSVATWTFGNANRFDLLASPRLAGLTLDASCLVDPLAGAIVGDAPRRFERRAPGVWAAVALATALALAGVGLALRGGDGDDDELPGPSPVATVPAPRPELRPERDRPPQPPSPTTARALPPEERRRVAEALAVLAERFGVDPSATAGTATASDPGLLMERIARELRYRGPFLTAAERDRLGRDPSREAALALRWDAQVRRFADDRPLPEGFRRAPLAWQLGVFAWSFHQPPSASSDSRAPAEVAHALADTLAVDFALRSTPLSARYPALASYLAFLGRLPRR